MASSSGRDRVTIGIDVGGTNVRAARIAPDGTIVERRQVGTHSGPGLIGNVGELAEQLLDDDVEAIGVGIPGRLDVGRTTILSAGFVDLGGRRFAEDLSAKLDQPVFMDNDAHLALGAELAVGAAISVDDVVLFTVGTGIGGAVAIGRRLVRGRGNAGQLGHLALDGGDQRCNCGRTGCSEVLASGTALAHRIDAAGLPAGTTADDLLERAAVDRTAETILRPWARAWRAAIDTVVAVLDPELVILGGGLGSHAAAAIERYEPETSPWFDCPVQPAALGDDAGVVGAGLAAAVALRGDG